MRFFNIDKALELPQTFNVMHEALDDLYAKRQEEFEKNNPLTYIYKMVPLTQFQKTFGSSTGFKQAFEGTVDYSTATGFTNGDGFKFTIGYKPFSGKVVFTWQALLEADPKGISETLDQYQTAWHRQLVQYGMFALTAFFGGKIFDSVSKTYLQLTAADTPDGDTMNPVKNAVFSKNHTVVRREGMSDAEFNAMKQSNKFYIPVDLNGSDPLAYAKLANGLYQVKSLMNNYLDDNGQLAGVSGRKSIVMTDDAHLKLALKSVMAASDFTQAVGIPTLNPIQGDFDLYNTAYLQGNYNQSIPQFAATAGVAKGLLLLDKEYNSANKGPIMVERVPFSMKPHKTNDPEGITYMGKQAFDFFCPSWRGIAYIYIGTPNGSGGAWNDPATFTAITPIANAMAVNVTSLPSSLLAITVTPTPNASVVVDSDSAHAGDVVTAIVTPASGYKVTAFYVNGVSQIVGLTNAASTVTFIMPNTAAVITYTVASV
jgi:hypothetical protein